MRTGETLLNLARAAGPRPLFIVGTGKNVGKTVAMRAVAQAAARQGLRLGLTSMGRDGEAFDEADALAKPRLFLSPGTIIATARGLLPRHPASEMLALTPWTTAAGNVAIARVREAAHYELAGPAAASAMRACVAALHDLGCDQIVVDGALDRLAAIAGVNAAVILAAGASASRTPEESAADAGALCARLKLPPPDPDRPLLRVEGALTPARAAALFGESRQIVVADPTRIAATGRPLSAMLSRLDLRCERPIRLVAATVASVGRDRYFEPQNYARAIARACGVPVFDVYAGSMTVAA
jgi:hypothetical protein